MKNLLRRTSLTVTAVAAATTALALPAPAALADDPLPCPRVYGVCAWTEPDGQGALRLLFQDEPDLVPPVQGVQNQTAEPWCVYQAPEFHGEPREIAPSETVRDLGGPVFSARRGPC